MSEDQGSDGFGMWAIIGTVGPREGGRLCDRGGVYRLTPVSEEVARAFAVRNRPRPVHVYGLQLPKPAPVEVEAQRQAEAYMRAEDERYGPDDFDEME